jgi:hypothetical protein
MKPFETYISNLARIRGRGVAETSGYGALETYLNEIGKGLKPKVVCIINTRNKGAGIPDGGFFTADQLRKIKPQDDEVIDTPPERGAMEVKPVADEVLKVAASEQVKRYLDHYGQVLVTTYREFVLLGKDKHGRAVNLDSYSLADTEAGFWEQAVHPRKMVEAHAERLEEFLKRALWSRTRLEAPEDLAWFLASYARDALAAVEASDLPALQGVRQGFEEALGLTFEDERGDHFFRSTLVQTLFYGVFSAWVLWDEQTPRQTTDDQLAEEFNWKDAAWYLRVPMIKRLFEQLGQSSKLGPLGIKRIMDLVGVVLNRVDRNVFFERFRKDEAVQYFYEPFLEAYDPQLRKDLGVWYTPQEVVRYMVARVDTVLKEELCREDGLADPEVFVLDPCCGTGAFLVEVLRHIRQTMQAKGGDALMANDLKRAAMERVFGFEIMPAPFVIAHLQIGLLLQGDPGDKNGLRAPLAENERAGVYLTNALTGWEPVEKEKRPLLEMMGLTEEVEAAAKVKQTQPILVVLGNPPYNAFAGVSTSDEEKELVRPYKEGLQDKWGIKKFNLDDLYVRFFRLAERTIAEREPRKGVVCYISNFSYLGDPSFVVMRQRFLQGFDKLWLDCMNGDSRETGKVTPDGKPDPSVFSTDRNREGIRVGTAIGLLVRKEGEHDRQPQVYFRHFWGASKRADLVESLETQPFGGDYEEAKPEEQNRYTFRPMQVDEGYQKWPLLTNLCLIEPLQGIDEDRAFDLIEIERQALHDRMQVYFDKNIAFSEIKNTCPGLTRKSAAFEPKAARKKLLEAESFMPEERIRPYELRPLDARHCYYTPVSPIWKRSRPDLWLSLQKENFFVLSRPAGVASPEGVPFLITNSLFARDSMRGHAVGFPLLVSGPYQEKYATKNTKNKKQLEMPMGEAHLPSKPNLSSKANQYLQSLGIIAGNSVGGSASFLWWHVLAIGFSPSYLEENLDGIKQNWPRIPMPKTKAKLEASTELGRQVAALLDTNCTVQGVDAGAPRAELKIMGNLHKDGNEPFNAVQDLRLTAGWGHDSGGAVMPGKGRWIEREYTTDELNAIKAGVKALGIPQKEALARLGETAVDVYLNFDTDASAGACWRCVPKAVWDYHIGGYQVIKKWLSYREEKILGRPLTADKSSDGLYPEGEARYVTAMVRRLAAILLLGPALDANYESVKKWLWDWE